MKILIPLVVGLILAGGSFSSCKYQIVTPPDTTHKCDTCCDTCIKPCDTCVKPCDTCNINKDSLQRVKDSLSHAFEWKEYPNPGDRDHHWSSVWVFGEKDIILVGDRLWHFDGQTFTGIDARNATTGTSMNGALSGSRIFALSKTDYWITHASAAFHTTNGSDFEDNRKGAVNACWGTSSSDMYFAGNAGHVFHYDGTTFSDMVSNTSKNISSIWGTSDNNIWAAGFNPSTAESVILHYNGSEWTSISPLTIGNIGVAHHALGEIWACDSSSHNIAIAGGSLLWRNIDNILWTSDSGSIPNRLSDGSFEGLFHIRGNSSTDFIATGDGGFIAHWNGKTWKRYDQFFNPDDPTYGTNACSMKGNTVCIVGLKNGQPWMVVGTRKQ
jgi:hypothetical protein